MEGPILTCRDTKESQLNTVGDCVSVCQGRNLSQEPPPGFQPSAPGAAYAALDFATDRLHNLEDAALPSIPLVRRDSTILSPRGVLEASSVSNRFAEPIEIHR